VGDAVFSFGRFSGIPEVDTFRVVARVKNASSDTLEIHQGGTEDDPTTVSHMIINYTDGRAQRLETVSTLYSQLVPGEEDWMISGETMTADEFTTQDSSFRASGSITNVSRNEYTTPLVIGVLLDAKHTPISYSVGSTEGIDGVMIGDDTAWSLAESMPDGITTAAETILVVPRTSADQWSAIGDMIRDLIDITH
jgi:hypothetical protein